MHLRDGCGERANVKPRIRIRSIALDAGAAFIAAVSCGGVLALFADAFSRGATWSGLNPNGGGPGFVLLLITGGVSVAAFRKVLPEGSVTTDVLWSALFALLCGGLLWLIARVLDRLPSESVAPLVSGVVGSYFVPRVVVFVLQDTWTRAEGTARVEAP